MRIAPHGGPAQARYRTVGEEEIIESLLIAAQPYELAKLGREAAFSEARAALDRWVKAGLGYAASGKGERLFDPVEVTNHMKWTGLIGLDDFWARHFVRTSRAFTLDLCQRSDPDSPLNPLAPTRFGLRLERQFDLSRLANPQKARLRLPLPISSSATDIEVKALTFGNQSVRTAQSNGRLDFQVDASANPSVEIGADIGFTTAGTSFDDQVKIPSTELEELYLRPSEGLVRVTPRIRAIAQSLNTSNDRWYNVLSCWNYVIDELCCGLVRYDEVDAEAPGDWVLENGWYDCQLGSSLFVAMCRSVGIPARLLSGYMLYQLAPGFHYWAEVWFPGVGWRPFDFLSWDLSEGGRDPIWRTYFAGQTDYRMVTQCFPLAFTGPMSVRFPAAWHLTNAPTAEGMLINFKELDGNLIYSDRVSVKKLSD